jgi:hypothetical protein
MKRCLASSADFQYEVAILPIEAIPGLYSLEVLSQWNGARLPQTRQRLLQVTVDREGLSRLADLAQRAMEA